MEQLNIGQRIGENEALDPKMVVTKILDHEFKLEMYVSVNFDRIIKTI